MKLFRSLIFSAFVLMLGSSCVSRTVTVDYVDRGHTDTTKKKGATYGDTSKGELVEKKLVWFWQKDFRTPK
jgi:hypothetical protein